MHASHSRSVFSFVSHTPSPLPPARTYTRGKADAALSAVHWEVLLLTAVWIEAAVHPLLSGCCRAAGLAFVLLSIMARHNYSLSTEGAQAASTLPLALSHLTLQGQRRQTQADASFMCLLKWNVSVCNVFHTHSNSNTCSEQILKGPVSPSGQLEAHQQKWNAFFPSLTSLNYWLMMMTLHVYDK